MSRNYFSQTARAAAALLLGFVVGCKQPDQPQPDQRRPGQTSYHRTQPVPADTLEVHYAPFENLESIDTDLLAQAHTTIDLAAYSLTDYAVAQSLIEAAQRGVRIRIYRDATQAAGEAAHADRAAANPPKRTKRDPEDDVANDADSKDILRRLASTRNITVRIKHSHTLMHLKAYAVDGAFLRTGSANFSPTGEKRQDNDLLLIRNANAARNFTREFNLLWDRPDNEVVR